MDKLTLVLPCYNEEEILESSIEKLKELLSMLTRKNKISPSSDMLFVDDGSKDKTWKIIEGNHFRDKRVKGLKLAGNVGHQNALWAGLMAAKENADILITIDADLQDDINVIEEMIDKFHEGKQIVYGVKKQRKADSFIKRFTAQSFYKLMELFGVDTVYNHADFRLLGKIVADVLEQYKERNLFIRGIIPSLGFESDYVYEEIREREAGKSKYSLKKMLTLATNGITSFSTKPLALIGIIGLIMVLLSIILTIQALVAYFSGEVIPGWTSLTLSIWFIGGTLHISLGIIGEYIGKQYIESKGRPRYIIEKRLTDEAED